MTTTDKPTYHVSPPEYLTDEYEVVENGRTLRCRKLMYRGEIYESCYEVDGGSDVLEEVFAGRRIQPGDPGYDDLVAYMDQFLIPAEEPISE